MSQSEFPHERVKCLAQESSTDAELRAAAEAWLRADAAFSGWFADTKAGRKRSDDSMVDDVLVASDLDSELAQTLRSDASERDRGSLISALVRGTDHRAAALARWQRYGE